MLLGVLGDQHLTNHRPIRRIDDYWQSQLDKLDYELQSVAPCDAIIQVGDFFDTPYVANRVKAEVIRIFNGRKKHTPVYAIFGQHDISGHSAITLPNSPLAVLEAAGVLEIIGSEPRTICVGHEVIYFYGASFGQEIPEVKDKTEVNVLVTHQMIGDRPLYPGQELQSPKRFLVDHPDFQFVFCGDYHYRFKQKYQDRMILNPGALMRKSISQWDLEHKPGVFTIDTQSMVTNEILLPSRPVEEVFNLTKDAEKDNETLLKFIETLQAREGTSISWKEILQLVIKERMDTHKPTVNYVQVRKEIDEVLEQLGVPNGHS